MAEIITTQGNGYVTLTPSAKTWLLTNYAEGGNVPLAEAIITNVVMCAEDAATVWHLISSAKAKALQSEIDAAVEAQIKSQSIDNQDNKEAAE